MSYQLTRSDVAIDDALAKCDEAEDRGGQSRYPGMTYEQGVQYALMWVTGQSDDPPFEE